MTLFIDLRASGKGGIVADEGQAWVDGTTLVSSEDFAQRVRGRDLFLATHGFNVDRQDGIDSLSLWSRRCPLPVNAMFIGVLWPGDSRLLPFVNYVYAGTEAMSSGKLLAAYLNKNAVMAQSLAFFSHSLGVRVVLQTIRDLNTLLPTSSHTRMNCRGWIARCNFIWGSEGSVHDVHASCCSHIQIRQGIGGACGLLDPGRSPGGRFPIPQRPCR
jgi:Alpha/beta hydrolase of unknown function (DUF900)